MENVLVTETKLRSPGGLVKRTQVSFSFWLYLMDWPLGYCACADLGHNSKKNYQKERPATNCSFRHHSLASWRLVLCRIHFYHAHTHTHTHTHVMEMDKILWHTVPSVPSVWFIIHLFWFVVFVLFLSLITVVKSNYLLSNSCTFCDPLQQIKISKHGTRSGLLLAIISCLHGLCTV